MAELGTIDYPYKTIDHPSLEVWNYWKDDPRDVEVKLMEDTDCKIYFQENPFIWFNRTKVTVLSYTTRTEGDGSPSDPMRSRMVI